MTELCSPQLLLVFISLSFFINIFIKLFAIGKWNEPFYEKAIILGGFLIMVR